ncbi:MAG: DUF1700 domain-containing protein [Lachnospiraceae bacterium]|nr:DUF1700 domain-containing protein [Lachnospiraceae bacterium]
MKKEEYMSMLQQELTNEDAELRDEILNDYEEHFDAGIKSGKSEEEICEELGSISEFMDELRQMKQSSSYENSKSSKEEKAKADQNKENKEGWNSSNEQNRGHRYGGHAYYNSQNGSKSYSFDFDDESFKRLGDRLNQLGEKISRRVNDIVSDMTDSIHHEYYGKNASPNDQAEYRTYTAYDSTEVESVHSQSNSETDGKERFHKIRIIGKFADVIVEKDTSDSLHVSARNYGSPKQQMLYRLVQRKEGDTLVFELENESSNNTFFFWKASSPCMKIFVSLPSFIEELSIENGSGDVELHSIRTAKVVINAGSGDVMESGCEGAELRIKTGSGDIRLEKAAYLQTSFEAGSGDITIDGITCEAGTMHAGSGNVSCRGFRGRNLNATTGSGDISFYDGDAEELKINTSSGDIQASELTTGNFMVHSASGDIDAQKIISADVAFTTKSGDCQLRVRTKKCHAESVSGDVMAYLTGLKDGTFRSVSGEVKAVLQDQVGFHANVRTVSGEACLRYHGDMTRVKTGTYSFGNEECNLTVNSVSGDIDIVS